MDIGSISPTVLVKRSSRIVPNTVIRGLYPRHSINRSTSWFKHQPWPMPTYVTLLNTTNGSINGMLRSPSAVPNNTKRSAASALPNTANSYKISGDISAAADLSSFTGQSDCPLLSHFLSGEGVGAVTAEDEDLGVTTFLTKIH